MELHILSNKNGYGQKQRPYREYLLDGIPTIGVQNGETFAIQLNPGSETCQVHVAVDGTNILTGKKATLPIEPPMFVFRAFSSPQPLVAWAEDNEGGAQFVFTSAENGVALNAHGDISGKGYISVAVYVEAYRPPVTRSAPTIKGFSGLGTMRGGMPDMNESLESYRGAAQEDLAVGAGSRVNQRMNSTSGLIQPTYSEIVQVRYLPWSVLLARLNQEGYQEPSRPIKPTHPTGFEPTMPSFADLTGVPRIATVPQPSYTQFVS